MLLAGGQTMASTLVKLGTRTTPSLWEGTAAGFVDQSFGDHGYVCTDVDSSAYDSGERLVAPSRGGRGRSWRSGRGYGGIVVTRLPVPPEISPGQRSGSENSPPVP